MNFDHVNALLDGSPGWEQAKANTRALFERALGMTTAPVRRGGRSFEPRSLRAIELLRSGMRQVDVCRETGISASQLSGLAARARRRGLL
jgi:hypothetical protein